MLRFFLDIPKNSLTLLIAIYQKLLSPDHSFWAKAVFPHGYCRYQPTCSQYTKQAIQKYGAVRGTAKGIGRIFRCNPWSKGGLDKP